MRTSGFTALLLFAATAFAQNNPIDTARIYSAENYRNKFVPGEFIVAFKPGAQDFSNQGISAQARVRRRRDLATAKRPRSGIQAFTERKMTLMSSDDTTRDGTLANLKRLRQDPNVEYVEPNYIVHAVTTIPNDSSFSLLWGMQNTGQFGGTPHADIDATAAWDRTQGNPNLLIGIIDTGIDYLHPDLAANIWTNPGEIAANGIDDDGNGFIDDVHGFNFVSNTGDPMDNNNHGTHCAGTIAGAGNNGIGVVGVVWRAKLVALKFLDSTGSGTTAAAINAIAYANAMGITITSNSWAGGAFSQALKNVIDAAGTKGYLFIAAAGNGVNNNGVPNNNDATPQYPGSYTSGNIIAVAATDDNDAAASFSNYGATSVDLAAPGVNIYSTKPGNAYQYLSGTSMATPHVSGAAALIWGYNPGLTSTQVKNYLLQGVDSIASMTGKVVSGGRLNVKKALDLAVPPAIAYKRASITAVKNTAITPDTVVSTGTSITSYAMSAFTPLPAGLSLGSTTGIISGIPTVVNAGINDTIIATGPNGTGRTVVHIAVQDTAPEITYKHATISAVKNVVITPDTVVVTGTGAITSYAMSTSTPLPTGLSLNAITGLISGIPTSVTTAANDTVIATGPGGTGRAVVNVAVQDTAPKITYKHATISAVKNVVITPDSVVVTGTGAITGYAMSVSTPLPTGLSLNASTGLISGIPTLVAIAANDTVIATGPGGAGRTVVNITVADAAPQISYKQSSLVLTRNAAMIPDSVVSTGGTVTKFSISPALPSGLALDTITGIISGTPTVQSLIANYTVTATGPGGTGVAVVSLEVYSIPSNLSYADDPATYVLGFAITPNNPSVTGIISRYSINPPLPPGLSFDTLSGIITGTPTTHQSFATDYTVTADNPVGSITGTVNITVVGPPANLSYLDDVPTYDVGAAITPPDIPTVRGIVVHYSINPALPAGIFFDMTTGYIEGTPSAVSSATMYTIIAQNPGGSTQTTITLGVILPPAP